MLRQDKERIVGELTERLRSAETLLLADYRGLTMPQIDGLRDELLKRGARFSVVKNTLTRRAASAAGVEPLLALLDGPTAIAFVEADGDAAAVAKALSDAARDTRVLVLKGGVLQGRVVSGGEVEDLAKLPPIDVLRGQVLAAVIAPLNAIAALVNAPLRELVGLVDARIDQLREQGDTSDAADQASAAPEEAPAAEPATESEPAGESDESSDGAQAAAVEDETQEADTTEEESE